ncbi:MAG TPA: hypothetical protein VE685_09980, partial [Thermoanaerobaculia bacterium]|nr:hypothetical protein [Thermoanaerobaculia bacterium]
MWAWHRFSRAEDVRFVAAAFCAVLFVPLDEALWRYKGPFPWGLLAPRSEAAVAGLFFFVYGVNALLLHLYLSRKTPDERSWPRWLRVLRSLFGGLPLVGLAVVPLWRRLLEERPGWARRKAHGLDDAPDLTWEPGSPVWRRWTDAVEAPWLPVWLVFSGCGVLLFMASWLAIRSAASPGAYRTVAAVSLTLHLVVFAAVLPHLRREAARLRLSPRSSIGLTALSVLWLLPVLYVSLPAVLLYFWITREPARSESVIYQALIRYRQAGRLPLWIRFEDRLRRQASRSFGWRSLRSIDRGVEKGKEERSILRLYDLQGSCAGLDAAAIAWVLAGTGQPGWAGLRGAPVAILAPSFFLCLAGLCVASVHFVLLLLRAPNRLRLLDRHPYASTLARTQFAFLAGWAGGAGLRTYGPALGPLVTVSCMLLLVLKAITIVLRPLLPTGQARRRLPDDLPGLALLLLLSILGAIAPTIDVLTPTLAVWAVLYPVRAFLLGRFLVPWLLRPFEWKDLFASGIPIRLRVLLASL